MSGELRPCPFCGSAVELRPAIYEGDVDSIAHLDYTGDCGLDSFTGFNIDRTVITAWNTRSPTPTITAEREACAKVAGELERCRVDRGIGERVTIPLVLRDRVLAALRTTPEATDVAGLVEKAKWNAAHYAGAVADEWQQVAAALASQAADGARKDAEITYLRDYAADIGMLGYKWMEAHDCLKAGKPYNFPEPADLPNALAEIARLERVVGEAVAAMERITEHHTERACMNYEEAADWTLAEVQDLARAFLATNQGGSDATD